MRGRARSSATCTAARRSCSRPATTGRSSCWPTGTTGCRRSANELGVVLAVERMLGMEVPQRAVWARTLLAELNRVLNHLMFLGLVPDRARRHHADVLRVPRARGAAGGDGGDLRRPDALHVQPRRRAQGGPPRGLARTGARRVDRPVRRRVRDDIDALVRGNDIFRARTRGVGCPERRAGAGLRRQRADRPRLRCRLRPAPRRALPRLRRARPTCCVSSRRRGRLPRPVRVPARPGRRLARPRRALPRPAGRAAAGPINVRLPKVVKAPEGDTYAWTENPLGINGYYLVSAAARRRPGG